MLGLRPYEIHTSSDEPLFQGFATDRGLDDDLSDLSRLPAASTDDFSPWGRWSPKGGRGGYLLRYQGFRRSAPLLKEPWPPPHRLPALLPMGEKPKRLCRALNRQRENV